MTDAPDPRYAKAIRAACALAKLARRPCYALPSGETSFSRPGVGRYTRVDPSGRVEASEPAETLADAFADYDDELRAAYTRSQTPGTPEHAQDQARAAVLQERDDERVRAVVAAGGVIGVTHTDKGEPLADASDDADDSDDDDDDDDDGDTDD